VNNDTLVEKVLSKPCASACSLLMNPACACLCFYTLMNMIGFSVEAVEKPNPSRPAMSLPFIHRLMVLGGKVRRHFGPCCQNAFFLFSQCKKIRMDFLQRSSMLSRHSPQSGAVLVCYSFREAF